MAHATPAMTRADVRAISAGTYHACAVLVNGSGICWGYDAARGGSVSTRPVLSRLLAAGNVAAVAAGDACTCVLNKTSFLVCDGAPSFCPTTPLAVVQLGTSVAAVSVGGTHVCAIGCEGYLRYWGGTGTAPSLVPLEASGPVAAVACGGYHTLALLQSGTVVCFGSNTESQCFVPPIVAQSGLVVAISAGWYHSCALLIDGSSQCWGDDSAAEVSGRPSGLTRVPQLLITGISVSNLRTQRLKHRPRRRRPQQC